jgi:hypothetical protein
MQNIKELKRVLSNHYATGPAKLFFTPITSAVETGMQSQLKPLYEICLKRIKVEVDENRNTVCIHGNDDCLLKKMYPPSITNSYVEDREILIVYLIFFFFKIQL